MRFSILHLIFVSILTALCYACSGGNAVTYGGQTYKTVKIGEQTWFAENLNYEEGGSKCYDNNPANCAKYGRLYDWKTAIKVCPKGWHLPNNEEWGKLLRFVDGDTGTKSPYKSRTAGKHLKATSGWNSDEEFDGNGTDAHGFSALPGGGGSSDGSFSLVGGSGLWWSASESENFSSDAYYLGMDYDGEYADWDYSYKSYFFSVRCIKD